MSSWRYRPYARLKVVGGCTVLRCWTCHITITHAELSVNLLFLFSICARIYHTDSLAPCNNCFPTAGRLKSCGRTTASIGLTGWPPISSSVREGVEQYYVRSVAAAAAALAAMQQLLQVQVRMTGVAVSSALVDSSTCLSVLTSCGLQRGLIVAPCGSIHTVLKCLLSKLVDRAELITKQPNCAISSAGATEHKRLCKLNKRFQCSVP
jgi:hypothetical protein